MPQQRAQANEYCQEILEDDDMTRFPFITAVMLVLLLTNCQSEEGGNRADGIDGDASSQLTASAAQRVAPAAAGEDVQFTTSDGVVIAGTLYSAGVGSPAVLCLHQWRSDRTSFAVLAGKLQQEGFTVLTIDMRGYGGSTRTEAGKRIRPDRRAQKDLEAALDFLRSHPAADGTRLGIVGASYGSSNALMYAASDPAIRALVLLSPGLNYFNELPTEAPLKAYSGRPLLAVASSEDLRSVETVEAYKRIAPGMVVEMYEGAGHGTDILDAGVGLDAVIIDFLKKNL